MSITSVIATGFIVGASVQLSADWLRQRRNTHSWLTPSAATDAVADVAQAVAAPVAGSPAALAPIFFVLDRLEQIPGFEPLYARRLNQSGILTYREMAELSPAVLQSMVAPNGPFNLPIDQWQAQARRLAKEAEKL